KGRGRPPGLRVASCGEAAKGSRCALPSARPGPSSSARPATGSSRRSRRRWRASPTSAPRRPAASSPPSPPSSCGTPPEGAPRSSTRAARASPWARRAAPATSFARRSSLICSGWRRSSPEPFGQGSKERDERHERKGRDDERHRGDLGALCAHRVLWTLDRGDAPKGSRHAGVPPRRGGRGGALRGSGKRLDQRDLADGGEGEKAHFGLLVVLQDEVL